MYGFFYRWQTTDIIREPLAMLAVSGAKQSVGLGKVAPENVLLLWDKLFVEDLVLSLTTDR